MSALTIVEALMGVGMPDSQANQVGNTVNAAVTAAGNNLATATFLKQRINVVTTAEASTGVKLNSIPIGDLQIVQNLGANNIEVYPPSSAGIINGASAGGGITLLASTDVIGVFIRASATRWIGFVVTGPTT